MIPLQEHLEKIEAERERLHTLLDADRDLRYQQRFAAQNEAVAAAMAAAEKAIAAALTAAEKAVIKAETATERRFESVNEFRQTLQDVSNLQIPRAEYSAGQANLLEKIEGLSQSRDRSQGRSSGISASVSVVIAALAILATLAGAIVGAVVMKAIGG
jgi:hypothetical protein